MNAVAGPFTTLRLCFRLPHCEPGGAGHYVPASGGSSPNIGSELAGSAVCVPLQTLQANMAYQVSVAGTDNGTAFSLSWTFTTTAASGGVLHREQVPARNLRIVVR